jgi:uncharacterized damage-inducible protein DinB
MHLSSNNITEKLIEAHYKGRIHLLNLLQDLTEHNWQTIPIGSKWSIKVNALHILNTELYWMSRREKDEPEYYQNISLKEFLECEKIVSSMFIERIQKEFETDGFLWDNRENESPSVHWAMVRCIQHNIYHTGMISLLRQQIHEPLGDSETMVEMIDSLFYSVLDL